MDSHVEEGCSSETLAFMELAIEQAKDALNSLEVPVGCVIVEDGKVIASGRNRTTETRNATRHAEMEAIDVLLEQWQKSGLSVSEVAEKFSTCSLYVTCEPCIMCAAALSILGIKEVYYGCANDKFGGCGSILSLHCSSSKLPNSGDIAQRKDFKCTGGIMALEAVSLLRRFYEQGNPNGESNTVALMLRDTEPCTGGVRVVKRFSSRSSRLLQSFTYHWFNRQHTTRNFIIKHLHHPQDSGRGMR